jgi:hypothetical protein
MNGGVSTPLDNGFRTDIVSKDSLEKVLKHLEGKKYLPGFGDLVMTQPNGTSVYLLPQDKMPCLVPDLSRTNYNMPILMKGQKISGMPPGSSINPHLLYPKSYRKHLQ